MIKLPDQMTFFFLIPRSLHTGESETVVASLVSGIFVGTNSAG